MNEMPQGELSLSHAAVDADLAAFLEGKAYECIPNISVFRTTRVGQIRPGKEWLAEIQKHLKSADRFLILLTPASKSRTWIAFETGAAWMRELPVAPVLAGGLEVADVPEPLKSLQLLSLEKSEEAVEVFRELGGELNDPAGFVRSVQALAPIGKRRALDELGWQQIEFQGQYYAWDGPLEELPEFRPLPIPDGLLDTIKQAGMKPVTGIPGDLLNEYSKGYAQLFHIDQRGRKHALVSRDKQVLLVNPNKRP